MLSLLYLICVLSHYALATKPRPVSIHTIPVIQPTKTIPWWEYVVGIVLAYIDINMIICAIMMFVSIFVVMGYMYRKRRHESDIITV